MMSVLTGEEADSVGLANLRKEVEECDSRVARPSTPFAFSVLGSWVKPYGTRLGIREGGKGAVRLPKIQVLVPSP